MARLLCHREALQVCTFALEPFRHNLGDRQVTLRWGIPHAGKLLCCDDVTTGRFVCNHV